MPSGSSAAWAGASRATISAGARRRTGRRRRGGTTRAGRPLCPQKFRPVGLAGENACFRAGPCSELLRLARLVGLDGGRVAVRLELVLEGRVRARAAARGSGFRGRRGRHRRSCFQRRRHRRAQPEVVARQCRTRAVNAATTRRGRMRPRPRNTRATRRDGEDARVARGIGRLRRPRERALTSSTPSALAEAVEVLRFCGARRDYPADARGRAGARRAAPPLASGRGRKIGQPAVQGRLAAASCMRGRARDRRRGGQHRPARRLQRRRGRRRLEVRRSSSGRCSRSAPFARRGATAAASPRATGWRTFCSSLATTAPLPTRVWLLRGGRRRAAGGERLTSRRRPRRRALSSSCFRSCSGTS